MFRPLPLQVALYQPGRIGNLAAANNETRWCDLGLKYRKRIFTHKPPASFILRRNTTKRRKVRKHRKKAREYNQAIKENISFEKTPSYMMYPHIPELISLVCPWRPKIIILLRNPIDRAYSHYNMGGTYDSEVMDNSRQDNYTFEETVQSNMDTMEKKGMLLEGGLLNPKWAMHESPFNVTQFYRNVVYRGFYANQIEFWLDYFPLGDKLMVVQYERFKKDKQAVIDEILEFVGASPYNYTDDVLHYNYFRKNETRIDKGISDSLRNHLKKVYKPHNDRLADLLGEKWRDVWD